MTTTPLALYVLWHPEYRQGAMLASAIYRWFHASSEDLLRSGLGIPVFYRSESGKPGGRVPRPIGVDAADINLIVVLAEANLVADPEWTAYLDSLAGAGNSVHVYPVSLHPSAYRLPASLRRLNFLRVDGRNDPSDESDDARYARRAPRLLRQLTESAGRLLTDRLLNGDASGEERAPQPLTLFLSHAKKDGVAIAEALRTSILGHGQLRAFFDESDLPLAYAFEKELEHAVVAGSAAMIAIVSDSYAARPWCRREVALARTPRPDPRHPHCWSIQPLIVVDNLESGPTRSIPEIGNAQQVRWQPERAVETIDLLMLEVILGVYHRLRARRVSPAPGRYVISWVPDLPTLIALIRAVPPPIAEIVYPGHGLPEADLLSFRHAFPTITFTTFESAEAPLARATRDSPRLLVGLSVGFTDDLASLGFGRDHLEELVLRVARCVIDLGGDLSYGGLLESSGLTETLLTLVRSMTAEDETQTERARQPRILSYQRWPAALSRERVASDVGISDYVMIDCPLPAEEIVEYDPRVSSPTRARQLAYALSAMRRAMTVGGNRTKSGAIAPPLDARVLIAGARAEFNGFMPGILEEALYAFERHAPVFILGGFGGAAALLSRALLEHERPRELSASYHRDASPRFRVLESGLRTHGDAESPDAMFARLDEQIDRIRPDVAAGLNNRLDAEENRRLMRSESIAEIIALLRTGLSRCAQAN